MAWLTVSEAAETLAISEAAVRKRMQRGTLRHRRGADGRVYTYLDAIALHTDALKGVEDDGLSPKERNVTNESRAQLLNFSDVASLVAVVSASTYIAGLFVFWYPIATTYTGDFATAWYVTSLVPRNVVIGHGIKELLLPFLATVLVIGPVLYFNGYALNSYRRVRDELKSGRKIAAVTGIFLSYCMGYLVAYLLFAYYLGSAVPTDLAPKLSASYERLSPSQVFVYCALNISIGASFGRYIWL